MKKEKRIIAFLLMLAVALTSLPCSMEVQAAKSGDFEYEVNSDGESVAITGYRYDAGGGNIVIPSEIDGKKVTAIGKSAFYECKSMTGVTIPAAETHAKDKDNQLTFKNPSERPNDEEFIQNPRGITCTKRNYEVAYIM